MAPLDVPEIHVASRIVYGVVASHVSVAPSSPIETIRPEHV
jgi:hypothetical protein